MNKDFRMPYRSPNPPKVKDQTVPPKPTKAKDVPNTWSDSSLASVIYIDNDTISKANEP